MQAGTESSTTRRTRGRKDSQGTEAIPTTKPVLDELRTLQNLYDKKGQAADNFNKQVKKVAEAANLNSAVVRRLVTAKAGNFEKEKRLVEQTALLFDAVEVETEESAEAAA